VDKQQPRSGSGLSVEPDANAFKEKGIRIDQGFELDLPLGRMKANRAKEELFRPAQDELRVNKASEAEVNANRPWGSIGRMLF
jgi:hypothetical protein